MRTKRGQALLELAIGLFTLALVISTLTVFSAFIARTLELQNGARVGNPASARIEVDGLAETYLFGTGSLRIREKINMPSTIILR